MKNYVISLLVCLFCLQIPVLMVGIFDLIFGTELLNILGVRIGLLLIAVIGAYFWPHK